MTPKQNNVTFQTENITFIFNTAAPNCMRIEIISFGQLQQRVVFDPSTYQEITHDLHDTLLAAFFIGCRQNFENRLRNLCIGASTGDFSRTIDWSHFKKFLNNAYLLADLEIIGILHHCIIVIPLKEKNHRTQFLRNIHYSLKCSICTST